MTITIEMIDEWKKRANISFEEAKMVLERYDGNIVESLIYLEKQKKTKSTLFEEKENLFNKVKVVTAKGNAIRFIVSKDDRNVLNLSLTASIILGICTFHITFVALIVALFAGYRFRFERNGSDMKVNSILNKVHNDVDDFRKEMKDDFTK